MSAEPATPEPIPLVKLTAPTEVVAYACGQCGSVHGSVMVHGDAAIEMARACCAPRTCEQCGADLGEARGWLICRDCQNRRVVERERKRFEAAKKLTVNEWALAEDIPEPVVDPNGRAGNDGYCDSLDDFREFYVESPELARPSWAWATHTVAPCRPDAYDIIEGMVSDLHEDAGEDFDAVDLQKRLDAWFDEQRCISYQEDSSIAIVLGEDFWGSDQADAKEPDEPKEHIIIDPRRMPAPYDPPSSEGVLRYPISRSGTIARLPPTEGVTVLVNGRSAVVGTIVSEGDLLEYRIDSPVSDLSVVVNLDPIPMEDGTDEPVVCPGCYAVNAPCAPGCIDEEIRRDREASERETDDSGPPSSEDPKP